jgi:hypothetical protein
MRKIIAVIPNKTGMLINRRRAMYLLTPYTSENV